MTALNLRMIAFFTQFHRELGGDVKLFATALGRQDRSAPARRLANGGSIRGMTDTCRLAAILSTNVAGYSRLMGADEKGRLVNLKTRRTECAIVGRRQ
jgi:class 3 adenylate cyclase